MKKIINLLKIFIIYLLFISNGFAVKTDYFIEGKNLFEKREFAKSKILFERDIVFNPKSENSYLYLAKIFYEDENDEEQDSSEAIEETNEIADEVQENDIEQESPEENDGSSPYGAGSATAEDDGSQPSEEYQIKGKVSSKIYHPPESPFFSRTKADVWFTTSEVAEKAGFSLPSSMQDNNEDVEPSSKNENEETGEDNEAEEGE